MKTNTYSALAVVVVICGFALYSCTKDSPTTSLKNDSPTAITISGISYSVDPSNSANPYDYIGLDHNAALNYMGSYTGYRADSPVSFIHSACEGLSEYENSKGNPTSPTELLSILEVIKATYNTQNGFFRTSSDETKNFFIEIREQVLINVQTVAQLSSEISNIKEIEYRILCSNTLNNYQKAGLLGYSSICRYSSAYAFEVTTSGNPSNWDNTFSAYSICSDVQHQVDVADADGFERAWNDSWSKYGWAISYGAHMSYGAKGSKTSSEIELAYQKAKDSNVGRYCDIKIHSSDWDAYLNWRNYYGWL